MLTTSLKWAKTITALVELMLLGLCTLAPQAVDGHILVYRSITNQLIEEYNDLPAQFGPSLPPNGIKVYVMLAKPDEKGCTKLAPPDNRGYPDNAKFVAIIKRGGENCSFELKVRNAQAVNYSAVIVYNNEGDELEQMSAANSTGIRIPSVFVGLTTGTNLVSFMTDEVIIVIDDELPFNINTQLILPFSILIGLCFLIMIFYMIYKCIREERRLRRYRLPKSMLKKLPILKYTKNSDFAHETCVICIEDFVEGDKLRVLPCKHSYHSHCIDPWLTENRRVCPICKRKVFTKGEARSTRNRQTSLDSVTDTDDDTTPLLQPSSNANNNNAANSGNTESRRSNNSRRAANRNTTRRAATNAEIAAAIAGTPNVGATTRHGTFRRTVSAENTTIDTPTSDDENVLLTTQQSPRRINPFDRASNLPPHSAPQLNDTDRNFVFSLISSLFRSPQVISVAAPPYLEEVVPVNERRVGSGGIVARRQNETSAHATPPVSMPPASNNILNPNLSGSFKDDDDDDMPHQSIYEPIATVTPTVETNAQANSVRPAAGTQDADSVFIQTPVQGGIGVVALPNTAFTNRRDNGANNGGTSRATDASFLI